MLRKNKIPLTRSNREVHAHNLAVLPESCCLKGTIFRGISLDAWNIYAPNVGQRVLNTDKLAQSL